MKICYLSDLGLHGQRFLDKFTERGYEVHAVSLGESKIDEREGVKFYNLPLALKHVKYVSYLEMIVRSTIFLKKLLKQIKPDVIHAGWVQTHGFLAALIGYHPFLLMPTGSDILIEPQNSLMLRMVTKYTLKKADMITCDCEFVKNRIIEMSGYPEDKIVTFPWGIDLKRFYPDITGAEIRSKLDWDDKKILIMTRNFEPIYGIKYFLGSLPQVIKEVPDTRVIMCGDGPLRAEFTRFVENHGLKDYVFFAGSVPNEELPKYYNAADIYVSASLSDGTSLSLLEAMACGLATIVTDVPSNMEWVKDSDNGFIVPRRHPDALATKIIQLLQSHVLVRKFGARNIALAREKADWDKNFSKLEKIYENLATRG